TIRRANAIPAWKGAVPTFKDDMFALRRVFYNTIFPVHVMCALGDFSKVGFFAHMTREKGLPTTVNKVGEDTDDPVGSMDRIIEELKTDVAEKRYQKADFHYMSDQKLKENVEALATFMTNSADLAAECIYPPDYRAYYTTPLSVGYGMLGPAHFLKTWNGELPEDVENRILELAGKVNEKDFAPGLFAGSSGIAWVLHSWGREELAEKIMETTYKSHLLFESADLFFGAAGWGLAGLYFYHKTGKEMYLDYAKRAAQGIVEKLTEEENGGLSYKNLDGETYFGLGHGAAGIALFMLRLYEKTREAGVLDVAKRLMEYELSNSQELDGSIVWAQSLEDSRIYPYFRHGSAGIGMTLIRFYKVLGEQRYLDLARDAAVYPGQLYSVLPGLFSGLTGIGEFMLDLHMVTGEEKYKDSARNMADKANLYSVSHAGGRAFPGDELLKLSADFCTGSAGIAQFFRRLLKPGPFLFLDCFED
nr:lanthionine synthetase C family protein [Acidobacteriota bacterium]